MITQYYVLLIILAVPTLVMWLYMLKHSQYRKYLFVVIPFVLSVLFGLIYMVDAIKAQPKNSLPEDYFFISSVEIPQKAIYMWIVEKGKDVPFTVMIPWTQQNAKKTQQAKQATSQGEVIAGKGKKKEGRLIDDETDELMLYQFQIKDTFKK